MAVFAQPTPDENLVAGWNNQGNFTGASTLGIPGAGFAQSGAVPTVTNVGQASAGTPQPPGAENIGSENAGSQTVSVLTNGSYSVTPNTSMTTTATLPVPTTAGVQQPFGVSANASVIGAAVTSIAVAPFTTGTPAYTTVATFTASANAVTVTVPPGGFIKTGGASATSVTYTPTF